MTSALDRFEQTLVTASRTLQGDAVDSDAHVIPAVPARRRGPFKRFRPRSLAVQLSVGVAALTVFAGAAASYAIFDGGPAREFASYSCDMSGRLSAAIIAVTGNPIIDCEKAWPQVTGGASAAPPLAIWGATSGHRVVAVVRPASNGRPADYDNFHWKRLPNSWTVNLPAVVLTDQLQDVGPPLNTQIRYSCSYAETDIKEVRSLIQRDGFKSWTVSVRPLRGTTPSTGCHAVSPDINGQSRNVLLIQEGPAQGVATGPTARDGVSSETKYHQSLMRQANLEVARIQRLYDSVNRTLNARCESVQDAAALWTRAARKVGVTPTTLAYWREVNARRRQDPATFYRHYTLYKQPPSQHTGNCAHILAMVSHDGPANIYAADITP